MTTVEQAVAEVVAAARWYCQVPEDNAIAEGMYERLSVAVANLEHALTFLDTLDKQPKELTWGNLLAGDELLAKSGEWHKVIESKHDLHHRTSVIKVMMNGVEKPIRMACAYPATIRRTLPPEESSAHQALRDAFGSITLLASKEGS